MTEVRLKNYAPRGLYGRAALILLVPVITLQLVVSVVFIQRHFEGVTRQMTANLASGIVYLVDEVNDATTLAAATTAIDRLDSALSLDVELPSDRRLQARRVFYDITGLTVIKTLEERIPGLEVVDLGRTSKLVELAIDTRHGPMIVGFDRRRVSASNPHQLLVLMVFAGALMTLVSFIFLRNQLRPIRRLARAADAFGKGQTVDYKPSGALEVRSAGRAFLDMRARIERQIEQRTLILSGVSHDLRTPLTRMKLELSMMDETPETKALAADLTEMERLIDTFLSFVRGDALDDPVMADPKLLLEAAVARARRAGKDVAIVEVTGEGEALMRPDAVGRALDNLIGNAVRYGTRAEVNLAVNERSVRFSIEDNGPGIPVEKRDDALRPFTRLDQSRNQNRGSGVGLGLAISQDIARRHGGSLNLSTSERLGGLKADLILAR